MTRFVQDLLCGAHEEPFDSHNKSFETNNESFDVHDESFGSHDDHDHGSSIMIIHLFFILNHLPHIINHLVVKDLIFKLWIRNLQFQESGI